jgi:hypothetical protein
MCDMIIYSVTIVTDGLNIIETHQEAYEIQDHLNH